MSVKHPPVQGTCLCGAVRYEVAGPLTMMVHCHCSMCRKHHGGSFATFVAAPLVGFRWISGEDNVASYASSEKGRRFFCKSCGSVTPTIMKQMDLVICSAGNLLGDLDVRPEAHWFVGSESPWYEITDSLPQHEEYPEEFGATGVTRPPVEARAGVVAGRCLCNAVAYEISGPPIRMMNCHCTRCRRGRSSAHATNLFYKLDDFQFVRGADDVVIYKVPDAKFFAVAFCRHCGGAVPRISSERGAVVVPAGSLDTDPGTRPQAHIYVNHKANWFDISDTLPRFPEGPPL
ncbi:GFA family protein [Povalibacter sp.]|uniref:GFA family protein n=1 Tax=Povalibacter sp. TaxID=1962978 RepID=UPI002F403D33